MSSPHYRMPSPDGRWATAPRNPTADVSFSDTDHSHPHRRSIYDGYPSSRYMADRTLDPAYRGYYDSMRSRPVEERVLEARPISSRTYRVPGQGTSSKTDYTIRPRSKTASESGRRPLSLIMPSTTSRSPIVTTGHERSRTPNPTGYESERYIVPASPSQSRDMRTFSPHTKDNRLAPGDRDRRRRIENGYLTTGGRRRKAYPVSAIEPRAQDIDAYDAYSYTNPKEQFYRDSDAIQESRRKEGERRKANRLSLNDLEPFLPRVRRESRTAGPPPSSRGFSRIHKDESSRESNYNSDSSRVSDSLQRRSSRRAPVALHQERERSPYVDDFDTPRDNRGYRIRRDDDDTIVVDDRPYQSSRESRHPAHSSRSGDDRRHRDDTDPTRDVHGGLATAGLASGYSKEHRDKRADRDAHNFSEPIAAHTSHRRHRRGKARHESDSETSSSEDDATRYRTKGDRPRHESKPSRHHDQNRIDPRKETEPQGTPEKYLPDKDTVASPVDASDPKPRNQLEVLAPQPKGILKQPTEKFPEDPNAVREGVAPLKENNMKGIPTGARWTKIDRRLVSPSALEGHERFEERSDYVIVLRVLTKEEIQGYAIRTAEIRARYHNPSSSRRDRRREDERRYGRGDRHSSDSDDEDDRKEPLAIEAPPPESRRGGPPPSDSRSEGRARQR